MLVDLHVYTNVSGGLPLPQAIAAARRKGFEGICVADRQASEASARWVAEGGAEDFPVFLAVEIPTRVGEMLVVVPELDPFYTREEWRALTALAKPSLDEVRALVDAKGGALLLTHPYDRARRVRAQDRFFSLTELDGVELATAGADPSSNALGVEAVSHARVPSFAGSAARKGGEKGGDWATLLATPVRTQAEFVTALRGGDFWPVELMDGQPSSGGDRRGGSGGGGGPRRSGSGGGGGGGGSRRGGGDGRRRR